MSLSVSGLNFFYRDNQVLNDVYFEIQKGELVSVLGPNGAGKTTLLKCINAMLCGVSGEILLDNQNIRSLSPTEIAGAIAYVPQRCETARLTVFDTVLLGRKPYFRWCVGKRDLKIVESALRQLQLSHLSLRHIDRLSGGELQKVSVARALVQEPRLLLLDEPTSALDLKSQVEIIERLKHIVSVHNMSALMTMHDLNTALRVSDQVIFLKNGRVWFKGIPTDVTSELVSDIYGVSVQMHKVNGHPMVVPIAVLSQRDTDNVMQF